MKVLELLLSDPDHYLATSADPQREVLDPWQAWINEIAVEFPGGGPAGSGVGGGSWDCAHTLWDLRWSDDGRCEVLVMNSETGDEFWWEPPKLPPAELMRHAKFAADPGSHIETVERAVELFRQNVAPGLPVSELAGHDLACWCPPGSPCHADVLLELANPKEAPDA